MKHALSLAWLLILPDFAVSAMAQAPFFEPLGFLPHGTFTRATAISADGSTVVGFGDSDWSSQFEEEAFRWTRSGGIVGMRGLPGANRASEAHGVSADGSVIVGGASSSAGFDAFRWSDQTGMVGLGDLGGRGPSSLARGTSADGSIVVGMARNRSNLNEAFRWTDGTGMVGLGFLPGGRGSVARGISADGRVIIAFGTSNRSSEGEAFRWQDGEIRRLGRLPTGDFQSLPQGISADGSVIVGWSDPGEIPGGAFRWTAETGMVNLGVIPGRSDRSGAAGVSADGSIVVGSASGLGEGIGFIWDAQHGMRSLQDVLENEFGLDLNGYGIERVTGVSADGRTFTGDYRLGSWVAHIPEPSTLCLLTLAALALLRRR